MTIIANQYHTVIQLHDSVPNVTVSVQTSHGVVVFQLPEKAKYIAQNKYGQWFWFPNRKPYPYCGEKDEKAIPQDWNGEKYPMQIKVDGFERVFATDKPKDFTKTVCKVVHRTKDKSR